MTTLAGANIYHVKTWNLASWIAVYPRCSGWEAPRTPELWSISNHQPQHGYVNVSHHWGPCYANIKPFKFKLVFGADLTHTQVLNDPSKICASMIINAFHLANLGAFPPASSQCSLLCHHRTSTPVDQALLRGLVSGALARVKGGDS